MQDQLKVLKEMIKSYGLNRKGMRCLKEWFLNDVMNGSRRTDQCIQV